MQKTLSPNKKVACSYLQYTKICTYAEQMGYEVYKQQVVVSQKFQIYFSGFFV